MIGLGIDEQINEILAAVVLDGRGRNQDLIIQGADQQACIDKLVGEERAIAVVELRAQLDGTRSRVDLVSTAVSLPVAS